MSKYEKYTNHVNFFMNVITDAETKTTKNGNTMVNVLASISSKVNDKYENTVYKVIFMNEEADKAKSLAKKDQIRVEGEIAVQPVYTDKNGEVRKLDTIFAKSFTLEGEGLPQTKEVTNRRRKQDDEGFDGDVPF
jgi:single-stranded DNA-binding protein